MSLKSRLAALERLPTALPEVRTMRILVDEFKKGPDAVPQGPWRFIVCDRQGNERVLSDLRHFFQVAALPEGKSDTSAPP
jgi:hypothetical protein